VDCKIMAIVNATPDSFSDGGRYFAASDAIARAASAVDEGAAIVDLGGESTRPGATPLSPEEEWGRIGKPVEGIAALCRERGVALSIDTYHAAVADKALRAGATMINCVYPGELPRIAALCEDAGAVLAAPAANFRDVARLARRKNMPFGLPPLFIDPMVGFGTTREEDLALVKSIPSLARECPVLAGISRKRIVRTVAGDSSPASLLGGSLGFAVWCALNGASAVRVHDVRETAAALSAAAALERA